MKEEQDERKILEDKQKLSDRLSCKRKEFPEQPNQAQKRGTMCTLRMTMTSILKSKMTGGDCFGAGYRSKPTVPDLITKKDTDKYFIQPSEQEDQDETETISSTSTADYDREEVKRSLQAIADAFHKIGNEYEHLCSIVPHMSKVQATNIIGKLPIIPFVIRETSVKKGFKAEVKTEPEKQDNIDKGMQDPTAATSEWVVPEPVTTTTTTSDQMITPEATTPSEQERTAVAQTTPRTPLIIGPDALPEEEVDIEKDAEASEKSKDAEAKAKKTGMGLVKTEHYNKYELTANGKMPEQKVNKGIKDINYHNMGMVIAVGDKVINKVGGIRPVTEKWGLSFSVLQRALSRMMEHRQGGGQYDKLVGRPQRRLRRKEKDKTLEKDESDEGVPPPKKSKTGK